MSDEPVKPQKPEAIVLHIDPAAINVTPFGFYRYGRDFSDAARSIAPSSSTIVRYFLECQAIELGLKAFLLTKGYTTALLAGKFGHDLSALLAEANLKGLDAVATIDSAEEAAIQSASKLYDVDKQASAQTKPAKKKLTKRFQYFDVGMLVKVMKKDLPDLSLLSSAADKLVRNDVLEQACLEA